MANPQAVATHSAETEKQRILGISRVVWEQVVVPWVLRPTLARRKWGRELPRPVVSCVLATAEAMFPLVALASRSVSSGPSSTRYRELGHYRDLENAAAALSPKCVAWTIANNAKNRSERRRQAASLTTRSGCDGADFDDEETEERIGGGGGTGTTMREMRREREWVAVLTGLCCGGHLEMAKRFVETTTRWDEEGGGGGVVGGGGGVVWLGESVGAQQSALKGLCSSEADSPGKTAAGAVGKTGGGVLQCDEFWSERGIFNLVRGVCAAGHLDVLQWLLTDVLQLNRIELIQGPLNLAAVSGHLHIIQWLVSTFHLGNDPKCMDAVGSFHPRKGRVSDVKCLVETFPHWDFSESARYLAKLAASCKGCPADEVIEVCQWLKDHFSLNGEDLVSAYRSGLICLPKSAKVVKWALSDSTDAHEMSNLWNLNKGGNVELGKWLVEEKGVTAGFNIFLSLCSGTHDNVEFVEWLVKKLGDDVSSSDLLNALHRALAKHLDLISKFLEKQILTKTGTRPKISLKTLLGWRSHPEGQGWLEWVVTHHSAVEACDINWSQPEVFALNLGSLAPEIDAAVYIWNRFSFSPVTHRNTLLQLLDHAANHGTSSEIQQVLSLGQFSRSEVEIVLEEYRKDPQSSKIVKLLVSSLFLCCGATTRGITQESTPPVITGLFFKMLSLNKRSCARWLFNKFNITPSKFLSAKGNSAHLGNNVAFATWKLMLRLFPQDITRDVVIHNFMEIVVASPLHTQFTMGKLGVTHDDIEHFCPNARAPCFRF